MAFYLAPKYELNLPTFCEQSNSLLFTDICINKAEDSGRSRSITSPSFCWCSKWDTFLRLEPGSGNQLLKMVFEMIFRISGKKTFFFSFPQTGGKLILGVWSQGFWKVLLGLDKNDWCRALSRYPPVSCMLLLDVLLKVCSSDPFWRIPLGSWSHCTYASVDPE